MGSNFANAFFSTKNKNELKTWRKLVSRVFIDSSRKKETSQVRKYTKICSNHFGYGRPEEVAPNPFLFLKGYDKVLKGMLRFQEKIHQLERKY